MAYIQIQWTSEHAEEAKKIARELIKKRWVACANIFPEIDSIYMWQGKIQEDREVKVFFKTRDEFFSRVRDYIIQHASYDVPEISKVSIAEGNPEYVAWLYEHVSIE